MRQNPSPKEASQIASIIGGDVSVGNDDIVETVVVDIGKKQQYLIRVDFGANGMERIFGRPDIRKLCEVDALDYARKWRSANGSFEIVAALKDVVKDKVYLIKEDLEEITVPKNKLGKADIAYINKMVANYEKSVAKKQKISEKAKLNIGDDVYVQFFSNWYPGVVTEVGENGQFLIETERYGGSTKPFYRKDIRKPCELNSIDFVRTWESSNGEFAIDAALRTVREDKVFMLKEDLKF